MRSKSALPLLATVFFMWGFITALNDILVPHLKAVFELSYTRTMLIQFVFFGAYFLMSLPAARLLEWLGYQRAIVAGLLITAFGAVVFVPAATFVSFELFLGALFVLATGITVLQVSANPYVTLLGPANTASSRLNLVQALNAFGTTVAPLFGGLLILSQSASGTAVGELAVLPLAQRMEDALAVRLPYVGIALTLLLLAVVIFCWRLPHLVVPRQERGEGSVWRHRNLTLGLAAIFFYVGAEVAIGSFLISYITSPHVVAMSHSEAAFYVSLFWGGAMVGRLAGAGIMRRVSPALVLGCVAVGAVLLLSLSIGTTGWLALFAIVAVGLMNSVMFPTIFSLGIEGLGAQTARGSALLVMAIVGGAVLPLLQGICADRFGLRLSFLLPIGCYLYILLFAVLCHRGRARRLRDEAIAPHIA